MTKEFTVTVGHTYTFKQGWGVHVLPIWDSEDPIPAGESWHDERISGIEVEVVEIAKDRVVILGGVPCVSSLGIYVPVENFLDVPDLWEDDTHDLRCRWFADRGAAEQWAGSVRQLWQHPNPWTAFVRVS